MFCPECGSILRPKEKAGKKILYCSCGFTKQPEEESAAMTENVEAAKKIEVVEKVEVLPKMRLKGEKCENDVVYFWSVQTRGADEPEARFFRRTKCNHTWREYA